MDKPVYRLQISLEDFVSFRQFPDAATTFKYLQRFQNAPKTCWLRVYIDKDKVYEWMRK